VRRKQKGRGRYFVAEEQKKGARNKKPSRACNVLKDASEIAECSRMKVRQKAQGCDTRNTRTKSRSAAWKRGNGGEILSKAVQSLKNERQRRTEKKGGIRAARGKKMGDGGWAGRG